MNIYPHDIINTARKITFLRLVNILQVYTSFLITKWLKKPVQWGQPFSLSIEPTTACNLRCPECPSGLRSFTRNTGNLKKDFFGKIIDELHSRLLFLIFYFQGEPYINPQFLEMVQWAAKKNIYTITSTNGHFLDEENARKTVTSGLDRLIISLDGTTQDVYQSYRKEGDIEKVIQGIKNVVKWKKELKRHTPHIVIQFLVVKPNEHQIPALYQLASELGVNEVKLKTAQIYDFKNGNELIPSNAKYSRYKQLKDGQWVIKNKLLDHCWKLWHSAVITWDGIVVPCCFDKDAQYPMGDLKSLSFSEIWQSPSYKNFRHAITRGRSNIDICANCTEGCKVWVSS